MILAFDIGNSNIVMGAFDSGRLLHSWRLHSDSDGPQAWIGVYAFQVAWGRIFALEHDGAAIGQCVPGIGDQVQEHRLEETRIHLDVALRLVGSDLELDGLAEDRSQPFRYVLE